MIRRKDAPALFAAPNPFATDLTTLVQYWLFYGYDRWKAATIAGNFDQRHEADWEAVTIGFSAAKPLFVAYSEHCGGHWYNWSEIQVEPVVRTEGGEWKVIDAPTEPALHPLIAVAEGSHANYLRSEDQRSPDWSSCGAHVSQATAGALSYVWNIRDRTGNGWTIFPKKITPVDENTPPMSFRGYWGASDRITVNNFRRPSLAVGKPGDGPAAPPKQRLWSAPIETIFCSEHWHPRACSSQ